MKQIKLPFASALITLHALLALLGVPIMAAAAIDPEPSFNKSDAHAWLRIQEAIDGDKGRFTQNELEIRYGDQPTYTLKQLKSLYSAPMSMAQLMENEQKAEAKRKKVFKGVKIRETYADVIASEDGSVTTPKEKLSQVKGASATFTRDLINDSDTWAGRGAIALPFVYRSANDGATDPLDLIALGFVPSASIHKVASEDPIKDIDSLIYRAGVFGTLAGLIDPDRSDLIFRASLAYGTDTDHDSEVWAGEFDIEPRRDLGWLGLGHKKWIAKPGLEEPPLLIQDSKGNIKPRQDWAIANYELRTWVHGEFGTVNNTGGAAGVEAGDFFRLGPAIDFMLNFPRIAPLTLNAKYRYLASLDENTDNASLFEASAEWTLWQNIESAQRVSAKVSYLNGGIDLTAEDAETILVGLGITF